MLLRSRLRLAVLGLSAMAVLAAVAQTPTSEPATKPTPAVTTRPAATQPTAAPAPSVATPPRVTKPATPQTTKPAIAQKAAEAPAGGHRPEAGVAEHTEAGATAGEHGHGQLDYMSMVFVFMLATFIGIGVIRRVSRLLHTPLMSLTNAISAIAVVGSLMLAGGKDYPPFYKVLGVVAMFASMTNIISGFLITDRMLKMFKTRPGGKP